MPPKPRQIRIEQKGALAAMQALQDRSDEELEREQKFKAAALAILGARAAERYDADAARDYFRRAIAASRPQERMQLRRMADASLALAERRPDDLKQAVERLGQAPPSNRQLMLLRAHGLPGAAGQRALVPQGARLRDHPAARDRAAGASASGSSSSSSLPFGGASTARQRSCSGSSSSPSILGVLALFGRRRQATAREKARAAQGG